MERERRERERGVREGREQGAACACMYMYMYALLDLRVSSLRRGHANFLCIVPILTDDPRRESVCTCACMYKACKHALERSKRRLEHARF